MFERYPESSVRALFLAKGAALATDASSIDVEHLFLGALAAWPAAKIRRDEIARSLGLVVPIELPGAAAPEIPFSRAVQRLLNTAMTLADLLGHHRIRPEHLLLALLEESDGGTTTGILQRAGLKREQLIRCATQEALSDDSPL